MDIILNALSARARVLIEGALHNKDSLTVEKSGNQMAPVPVKVLFDKSRTTITFPKEENLSWKKASGAVLRALDADKLDILDISPDNTLNFCLKADNERLKYLGKSLT